MILIRFPNTESKRAALGQLAGRFSFKSWANGDMLVPEVALPFLAVRGVRPRRRARRASPRAGRPQSKTEDSHSGVLRSYILPRCPAYLTASPTIRACSPAWAEG